VTNYGGKWVILLGPALSWPSQCESLRRSISLSFAVMTTVMSPKVFLRSSLAFVTNSNSRLTARNSRLSLKDVTTQKISDMLPSGSDSAGVCSIVRS
jgi:hypothetical protein